MLKVLTVEQMREVDRLTTERYGIPSILLMENAAHAVARVITEKLGGSVADRRFNILCGLGNNGGDGAALARILWTQGANCFVWLFGNVSDSSGDARVNFDALKKFDDAEETNGPNDNCLILFEDAQMRHASFVREYDDFVIDALFGTGLSRTIDGVVGELITSLALWRRRSKQIYLSIDIPSGIQSDVETIDGPVFPADFTVAFTAAKLGNILPPASNLNGELVIANIGSPQDLIDEQPSQLYFAENGDAKKWLRSTQFLDASYKNKRGHALLVTGSESYSGAAVLCGNAAMRSGVGLVTVAAPKECKAEIASRLLPDVILTDIEAEETPELLAKADAIAVGCGLSATDKGVEAMVRKVVEERTVPVIVDAGALGFYSPFEMQKPARKQGLNQDVESYALAHARASATDADVEPTLILTPHEGEFMRLLGTEDKDAIKDRVAAVREFAVKHSVILVLKGERVLIGEPGGKVVVNPTGNSGLGKAGNGDTLTGILAGFVAQAVRFNIDIFETVVAAVYVAGMAGDIAEKKYGKRVMTASDVRECLAEAFAACGQ